MAILVTNPEILAEVWSAGFGTLTRGLDRHTPHLVTDFYFFIIRKVRGCHSLQAFPIMVLSL